MKDMGKETYCLFYLRNREKSLYADTYSYYRDRKTTGL